MNLLITRMTSKRTIIYVPSGQLMTYVTDLWSFSWQVLLATSLNISKWVVESQNILPTNASYRFPTIEITIILNQRDNIGKVILFPFC